MSYQFQCPFCGVAMQADAMSPESQVECPSCSQSFIVEAPVQPVRVQASVVPSPPPGRTAPQTGRRVVQRPGSQKQAARREEERAKLSIFALLVGFPLLMGAIIWLAVRIDEGREEQHARQHDSKGTGGDIKAAAALAKANAERKALEEQKARQEAIVYAKRYKEEQERMEREEKQKRHRLLTTLFAREIFNGDTVPAAEAARIFQESESELLALYTEGNPPVNPDEHLQRTFLAKLLTNGKILAWAGGRSFADSARRAFGGRRGFLAPDGKPVDPDSVQGMLSAGTYKSSGTGFWISSDGWLVTNAHVAGDAASVDIHLSGSTRKTARVVKADSARDLALLKVDSRPAVWLPVTAGEAPVGRPVFTVGFPAPRVQGIASKFTSGEISSLSGMRDDPNFYQCSVPIQGGNSGGALIDLTSGWCVGVVSSKLSGAPPGGAAFENVSYAIKAAVLRKFIEETAEAKPLLANEGAPKNASGRDDAIQRAQQAAVLILVK